LPDKAYNWIGAPGKRGTEFWRAILIGRGKASLNILLTNDDGFEAPGIRAAYEALAPIGSVQVIAPKRECSACSHRITLGRPMSVERIEHERFGSIYAVDGTPADCVRLGIYQLADVRPDLLVAGINRGANAGVDVFYSGTVAAAREGAIFGIKSIAVSQAVRIDVEIDWAAAARVTTLVTGLLLADSLPGPGFWSVNLPSPIPADAESRIRRVPPALGPTPLEFVRKERHDGRAMEFEYEAPYWERPVQMQTDYGAICNGDVAVSAISLGGRF